MVFGKMQLYVDGLSHKITMTNIDSVRRKKVPRQDEDEQHDGNNTGTKTITRETNPRKQEVEIEEFFDVEPAGTE